MTAKELRKFIDAGTTTVVFMYNGKHACIDLDGYDEFVVCFGDNIKRYVGVDAVMNDKFYDGKSLNEIAEELDVN